MRHKRPSRTRDCPRTGKRSYHSRLAAAHALGNDSGDAKKPTRAYQCEYCSKWHLTSQPFR